jgi:hypothetical protein
MEMITKTGRVGSSDGHELYICNRCGVEGLDLVDEEDGSMRLLHGEDSSCPYRQQSAHIPPRPEGATGRIYDFPEVFRTTKETQQETQEQEAARHGERANAMARWNAGGVDREDMEAAFRNRLEERLQ